MTPEFRIKDKLILKWVDDKLSDYRKLIGYLGSKSDFLTCEELRDYLKNFNKEVDLVEFANSHISYLKYNSRAFKHLKRLIIKFEPIRV